MNDFFTYFLLVTYSNSAQVRPLVLFNNEWLHRRVTGKAHHGAPPPGHQWAGAVRFNYSVRPIAKLYCHSVMGRFRIVCAYIHYNFNEPYSIPCPYYRCLTVPCQVTNFPFAFIIKVIRLKHVCKLK